MNNNQKNKLLNKIQKAIKETNKNNFSKKTQIIILIIIFIIFAIISIVFKRFGIIGSVVGIFIIFMSLFLLKNFKPRNYLNSAKSALEKNNLEKLWSYLEKAYYKTKKTIIFELIQDLANYTKQEEKSELIELLLEMKFVKKTKKRFLKIYNNLLNTLEFILKCKTKIKEFKTKKNTIEKDLLKENNLALKEKFQGLVTRYDEMLSLENSKLEFYSKSKTELYELKNYHQSNSKFQKELTELQETEDSYFKNSFKEKNIPAENISDFIQYENSYIKALEYYSEEISNSNSLKMFEQLTKDFDELKQKTDLD